MVVMTQITGYSNTSARKTTNIVFRPISESGLNNMINWLENESWVQVTSEYCAHKKAEILQSILIAKYDEFFPEKERVISSTDQPFYNHKLAKLKRKKGREYRKHRRSSKWKKLEEIYQTEILKAKKGFYRKRVKHLRKVKPGKWYSELKKLTSFDQHKAEEIVVESIKDLSAAEQAELIADKFSEVANEYEILKTEDIAVPEFSDEEIPQFTEEDIRDVLCSMDTNKSNVNGDISAKVLKDLAEHFSKPVTNLLNASLKQGK